VHVLPLYRASIQDPKVASAKTTLNRTSDKLMMIWS